MIIIRTNWVRWFFFLSQTQRCNVKVPPPRGGRETHWPRHQDVLFSTAGRWTWQQILLDVDMWEDGTDHVLHPWCLVVWWDPSSWTGWEMADPSRPIAWHSEGYVHKGWTLLAWTVPAHIHLICKTWRIALEKSLRLKVPATQRDSLYKLNYVHTKLSKPELKMIEDEVNKLCVE